MANGNANANKKVKKTCVAKSIVRLTRMRKRNKRCIRAIIVDLVRVLLVVVPLFLVKSAPKGAIQTPTHTNLTLICLIVLAILLRNSALEVQVD